MIDKYIQHDCKRISPEAPVPVLTNPKLKRCLGGAANVVKNWGDVAKTISNFMNKPAIEEEIAKLIKSKSLLKIPSFGAIYVHS